jgi:hypothetical protein
VISHRSLRGRVSTFNKLRSGDDHKENGFEAGRVSRADGFAKEQTDFYISGQDSVFQWDKSGSIGGLSFLK